MNMPGHADLEAILAIEPSDPNQTTITAPVWRAIAAAAAYGASAEQVAGAFHINLEALIEQCQPATGYTWQEYAAGRRSAAIIALKARQYQAADKGDKPNILSALSRLEDNMGAAIGVQDMSDDELLRALRSMREPIELPTITAVNYWSPILPGPHRPDGRTEFDFAKHPETEEPNVTNLED